jgi:heme/copper-type cytochrome/quinol oxidase subunit 3
LCFGDSIRVCDGRLSQQFSMAVDFHSLHVLVHQTLHSLLMKASSGSLWRPHHYHLPQLIGLPFNGTLSVKDFYSTRAHPATLGDQLKLTLALAEPLLVSHLALPLPYLLIPLHEFTSLALSGRNQNIGVCGSTFCTKTTRHLVEVSCGVHPDRWLE